jgi:hypothetical protein
VSDAESAVDYYRRRAREERAAAERSDDERVRRSHLEMSRRYDEAAADGAAAVSPDAPDSGLLTPEFRVIN